MKSFRTSRNRSSICTIVAPSRNPFEIGSTVILPNGSFAKVVASSEYYTKVAIEMKTKIKEKIYSTFKLKAK